MRKFVILFGIICNMLILLAGCGSREDEISLDTNTVMEQEDEISLDTNMVMEQPEYVLNDFDSNNLQVVENHGLILKVPETWEVSVTEEGANKSITTNFEYGFMGIYANYSGEELDLTTFSEDYKKHCTDDAVLITDSKEEFFGSNIMEAFNWKDEVNGNKIHGTTYLFVTPHMGYNITLATYAEVSYEKELLNIMETFEFNEVENEDVADGVPSHVMELYNRYNDIISSGNYDIRLGEKVGIDDRADDCTYYRISLCPSDPDIVSYPCVQFYSDNESTDKSFSIDGLEYCSNFVVKEILFCTLAATNPDMTVDDIYEVQAKLVNSFDGYGQSDVVETELYKYFITTDPYFNGTYFEAVAKEEINIPVAKGLYSEYSIKEMQAELNVGEKAFVKGFVEYEEYDWITNTLCIIDNDKKYYVHYTPESFPGEFSVGNEYVFYGTISTECDTESGCLRLDYYEIVEDAYKKTDR